MTILKKSDLGEKSDFSHDNFKEIRFWGKNRISRVMILNKYYFGEKSDFSRDDFKEIRFWGKNRISRVRHWGR